MELVNGYSLDDIGNGRRLVATHGENLLWDCVRRKWYIWTGSQWLEDVEGGVYELGKELLDVIVADAEAIDPTGKGAAKVAARFHTARALRDMVWVAQSAPAVVVRPDGFDADPMRLNVLNGTLDLGALASDDRPLLYEHRRDDRLSKVTPIAFDSAAQCPAWDRFLAQIFDNNAEMISFVRRAAGYSLTGLTSEQCFFLLHGTGQNGKSTLVWALQQVLGDYSRETAFHTLLSHRDDGRPRSDIAALVGARFVSASEGREGARLSDSVIKALTGQDVITVRRLHENEFSYTPTYKLWLATNYLPDVNGHDMALRRRVRLIPFLVRIPDAEVAAMRREHGDFHNVLRCELPGILNWMLCGLMEYLADGLPVPSAVSAATDTYFATSDAVANCLAECCVREPAATVRRSVLYRAYQVWAEANREPVLTNRQFRSRMLELGHTEHDTMNARLWLGIGLVSERGEEGTSPGRPGVQLAAGF